MSCEVCQGPIPEERHTDPGTRALTCSPKCKHTRRQRLTNRSQRRRGVRKRRTPHERVKPVLGPLAKAAMRVDTGAKRRKLLVLIAAYADAGETSPAIAHLAARTGMRVEQIDFFLRSLKRDGLLDVKRGDRARSERNRYQVKVRSAASAR